MVIVSFDSVEFSKLKKKGDPLAHYIPQIKNVITDAFGVNSMPSYSPVSYGQRYPRAKGGLITLRLMFDISDFKFKELRDKDLNTKVSAALYDTRDHGHLFAKSAINSRLFN